MGDKVHHSELQSTIVEWNTFLWSGHCVKSLCIRSFSGPYFLAFGPEKLPIRTLFTQGRCSTNVNLLILDTTNCSNLIAVKLWTCVYTTRCHTICSFYNISDFLCHKKLTVLFNIPHLFQGNIWGKDDLFW